MEEVAAGFGEAIVDVASLELTEATVEEIALVVDVVAGPLIVYQKPLIVLPYPVFPLLLRFLAAFLSALNASAVQHFDVFVPAAPAVGVFPN